ncbi:hypothetical protein [Streptomyces sp.]|uniref:hypothetical protein n=1 Tax=Streptomyces sp. TaxID=1931 RepID=UPI002D79C16D|nr:hypothetical protein [Streptomyces sp.]HET6356063.1 hypothetical protein [Streptomyces sp.]
MTPYERLMAEELPTGTFGDAQPATTPRDTPGRHWTALEQLEHRRTLDAALNGWHDETDPRHLRAVRDQTAA